jgi:hypothetical protein
MALASYLFEKSLPFGDLCPAYSAAQRTSSVLLIPPYPVMNPVESFEPIPKPELEKYFYSYGI